MAAAARGEPVHAAPLIATGDVVDALDVHDHDGDVIEPLVTGAVMTTTTHVHLTPHRWNLIPGVVRFDAHAAR